MKRPNILFMHVDQMKQSAIGAFGCQYAKTPELDRLFGRGAAFAQSYCASPICMPARTSWYTGLPTEEHGQINNGMEWLIDPAIPDLGGWLRAAGYDSVYAGKWHVGKSITPSFDMLHPGNARGEYGDAPVARVAEAFLREREGDKPFFLNLGFLNPHDICYWTWAPRGASKYAMAPLIEAELPPLPANFNTGTQPAHPGWTEAQWRFYIYAYYRLMEMVDESIGRVMRALERSRFADNTLVIFSSDHGESAGEHHRTTKGVVYECAARVPLAVIDPAVSGGRRDDTHLVSGLDVPATICDYAGVDPLPRARGLSLRPLVEGRAAEWRAELTLPTPLLRMRMIRDDTHKIIENRTRKTCELFNLREDPDEMRDLAGDPAMKPVVARLLARMNEIEATYQYAPKALPVVEKLRG